MEAAVYFSLLFPTLSLLFFLFIRKLPRRNLPPGSMGLPLLGQTLQFFKAMRDNRAEEWLQQRAGKYGPISKLHLFGKPTVFLQGQAANKFIYTADENTLSNKHPASVRRIIGERNILELKGEDHKRVRRAFLSFMNPQALKQSIGKMDEEIQWHLDHHWHHNHTIKVVPFMKTLTFDMICTLLLGIERGTRRDKLLVMVQQMIHGMMSMPINLPFTRFNRGLRAKSKARQIIMELICEKKETLDKQDHIPNHQDFITSLLSMREETSGSPLISDEEIVDNCVSAMIGGYDTTSSLLSVLIKLLSENRQVYETVLKEQEEILRVKASGELLMWDDLTKMKCTWRVATEALRMYPPVLLSLRQVLKDIEMGGYTIPRGWQLVWSGCMTHLDESIFLDPYTFNPSRYEENGATPPHTFVAFGGGPRKCPGFELARIETLIMIHYFITRFKWKLSLEENVMFRDPTPTFKQGLPIQIEKISMI